MNELNTNEPATKKKRRSRFASFSLRALLLLTLLAALAFGFLNYTIVPRLRAQAQFRMIGEYLPWPTIDSSSDVNPFWRKVYELAGVEIDFDKVTQVDDHAGELPDLKFAYLTPNLSSLSTRSKSVDDLSPLAGLTKLGTLRIDHTSVTDLSPLESNSSLWAFSASCTSIKDFSPLRNLKQHRIMTVSQVELKDLDLLYPREFEDLSFYMINLRSLKGINEFKNLTTLRFDRCKLADENWNALEQLAGHESLRSIRIDDTEMKNLDFMNRFSVQQPSNSEFDSLGVVGIHFSELAAIPTCNSIKYLSLVRCKANQLETIPGFKRLKRLTLDGSELGALVDVGEMPELTELSMNDSKAESHDWIKKFHRLQRLEMLNTNFNDVSLLSELNELQDVNISNSSVENLNGLPVTNLAKLDLSGTKIKELLPLKGAEKLTELNLDSTLVVDLDPLSQCEVVSLNLSHTKIMSLKSLNIMKLKFLVLEGTELSEEEISAFRKANPFCEINSDWRKRPGYVGNPFGAF